MEDASAKTEQPTPQKLRDAQQKGMALRSPELSVLASLLLAVLVLLVLVPGAAMHFATAARHWIIHAPQLAATPRVFAFAPGLDAGMSMLVTLFVASLALALVAAAAYGGIHASLFPLRPDFRRLNPSQGFRRMFSAQTLVESARTILKVSALVIAAAWLARSALTGLAHLPPASPVSAGPLLAGLAMKAVVALLLVQLPFTAWDLVHARHRYLKQLRMSRTEIRDEHRRQEGDPEIRRRRRRLQGTLLAQFRALGNVRDADVVVTNPLHVAVALQYVPQRMQAPMVTCAGRGLYAALVRAEARRHGVPIVRRPALARALLADCPVGSTAPRNHHATLVPLYRWLLARRAAPSGAAT